MRGVRDYVTWILFAVRTGIAFPTCDPPRHRLAARTGTLPATPQERKRPFTYRVQGAKSVAGQRYGGLASILAWALQPGAEQVARHPHQQDAHGNGGTHKPNTDANSHTLYAPATQPTVKPTQVQNLILTASPQTLARLRSA